jgi:hypothetical protein
MKKILVIIAGVICATALVVHADDSTSSSTPKKHAGSKERKELVDKYDTNKDGKLDKDEIAKMTDEDKAKWDKMSKHHKKKDTSSK